MRKYLFFLLAISVLSAAGVSLAGEDSPAVLTEKDGTKRKVFLMKMENQTVFAEYQKLRQKKTFEKSGIQFLNFSHKKLDESSVETAFNNAEYEKVIQTLEPVVQPYVDYMTISNNLQNMYGTLMISYYKVKSYNKAVVCSVKLLGTNDPKLKLKSLVYGALSAADMGAVNVAKKILKDIEEPAAALYVKANIERAKGEPGKAIRTAVEIIAEHKNDMDWMPPAELLCAELYLDTGRTNSAFVTARQTRKLYKGMNVEKEAEALQSGIKQVAAEDKSAE